MLDIIEIYRETLISEEVKRVCGAMKKDGVQALALREVVVTDKDYKALLKQVASALNIRHLSLSIGLVTDGFRVQILALCIQRNRSLSGLFLHGNALKDAGIKILHPPLLAHPSIVALDVGDCDIGDDGLALLCTLLSDSADRPGLRELVLSGNPAIRDKGWSRLGLILMQGTSLHTLCVDYNHLTDVSASCLLMGMVGSPQLETLDMECTGVTEATGQLLLHLLEQYPNISLKTVNLIENDISQSTIDAIAVRLPGVQDNDNLTDFNSDEEHSLTTSEPPLDNDIFDEDLSENGSQICKIHPITVAAVNDSRADMAGETDSYIEIIDDTLDKPTEPRKATNPIVQAHKLQNRQSSTSLYDMNGEKKTENEYLRSSSVDAIPRDKFKAFIRSSSGTEYQAYAPETSNISEGQKSTSVTIEKGQNMDSSLGNFLIPETPSVVSLHQYKEGLRGQDAESFEPVTERPSSAPMNTNSQNHNSRKQADNSRQISVVKQSSHDQTSKKQELIVTDTRRRLSFGSVLPTSDRRLSVASTHKLTRGRSLQTEDQRTMHLSPELGEIDNHERDNIRRRLSSASIHQGGFQDNHSSVSAGSTSTLGDMQLEEIQ